MRHAGRLLLLVGLGGCVPGSESGAGEPKWVPAVHAEAGRLVDAEGRDVLLRGVNARVEGLFDVTFADGRTALEPIPPFVEADCAFLAEEVGANLLRLPLSWSALEPTEGQFDADWLAGALALTDTCAAHGVYTLLDLHQDAYSKEIGEDGAPLWAIVPPPETLLEGPLTDLGDRRLSPQVLAAFRSLYTDAEGLHAAYATMAAEVARAARGHAGVVGLELQNEPVPLGNAAALDQFHQTVADAVRAAAPELPLYFEPDSLRNLTDSDPVTVPFARENAVYAPHLYVDVFEDGWAGGDVGAIEASVAAMHDEAARHGASVLVGEFGHDPRSETGRAYLEAALDTMDTTPTSWAFWVYEEWSQGGWGLYDSDGTGRGALREEAVALLARPFPAAVPGRIGTVAWHEGTLTYTVEGASAGESVVDWPASLGNATVACGSITVAATLSAGRLRFTCDAANVTVVAAP
jgi:hypothetical protein